MLYLLYRYSSVHALLSSPLLSVPPTLLGPYAHILFIGWWYHSGFASGGGGGYRYL